MPSSNKDKSVKPIKRNGDSIIGKPKNPYPIIAMGGSAGSFQAFEKFFLHMPKDSGMSFVIIMHLDPNHKGKIGELIENFTSMPVIEAEDGMEVQPDNVYVIPPNKDMGIHNRKLCCCNRQSRMDTAFRSITFCKASLMTSGTKL